MSHAPIQELLVKSKFFLSCKLNRHSALREPGHFSGPDALKWVFSESAISRGLSVCAKVAHPSGYVAVFLTAEDAEKCKDIFFGWEKTRKEKGRGRREMQERRSIGFRKERRKRKDIALGTTGVVPGAGAELVTEFRLCESLETSASPRLGQCYEGSKPWVFGKRL